MSFLDSQQESAEDQGPPQGAAPPPGGAPGGPPGGPPQGGGPILAALANRQRQAKPSAPGPGDQASSMTLLMQAMGMMNQALPGLMGSPAYNDVLRALQRINKHLPQGGPTAGVQRTQLQDLLQNVTKNLMLSKIIGQQRPQPGSSPDQPAGAAPSPQAPPMPSTPLPGA